MIKSALSSSLILILVSALLSGGLIAREYHVEGIRGDDTASGTSDHPWKTIGRTTAAAAPGDTIVIHGGTYRLERQLAFTASGTEKQPITVTATPQETVLIDGGTNNCCITLQARSHIIFRNLSFTTASMAVGAQMVYMEATNYCEFSGCEFRGMPGPVGSENSSVIRCMATENGYSTGCIFRNNLFADNHSPALRLYRTDGWIIENNEFRNCVQAIGGKDSPLNMLVRRNRITGGETAFYFAGQHGCKNVRITENIVVGADACFQTGGLGTEGKLREDLRLFNNTFYDCKQFINGWDDGFTRGQRYYNNIFFSRTRENISPGSDLAGRMVNLNKYGKESINPEHYFMDWNCLSIPSDDTSIRFIDAKIRSQSIQEWSIAHPPFESHSISADPLFVDPEKGDFHLRPASPCIGKGMDGVDMGAYPHGTEMAVIGRISRN